MFLTHFRELWRYRVLIESLVWREVKARYRGSFFGFFWTLLNPLFLLIVYRFVFTKATPAVDMPNYAVFFFVGILPWLWLSTSLNNATTSIALGSGLITRVCMPPQVLPAVSVISNLVNFLLALPVAVAAAAAYRLYPSTAILALPLLLAIEIVFLYGVGLLLATLNVSYRDVQFLVQNLMMVWFLATPIAYPLWAGTIGGSHRSLLLANPATPLLVPFQEVLYFRQLPTASYVAAASAWAIAALLIGVRLFESRRDILAEEL